MRFPALLLIAGSVFISSSGFGQSVEKRDRLHKVEVSFTEELAAFDPILSWKPSFTADDLPSKRNEPIENKVTALEPFIVKVDKLPRLREPHENVVQKFFRTGTFAEHVGKKVTTRFGSKAGDLRLIFTW